MNTYSFHGPLGPSSWTCSWESSQQMAERLRTLDYSHQVTGAEGEFGTNQKLFI